MIVKIDNRENKLKEGLFTILDKEGISSTFENLSCGDFIIEVGDSPLVVFERKTLADLLASIKDGRYKIQKDKLKSQHPQSKIVFIIEGNLCFGKTMFPFTETDQKSIITSIINTQLRSGIQIMQTKSLEETCALICEVAKRIQKEPQKYILENINEETTETKYAYVPNTSLCKRVGSKSDLFYAQMSQIPSISGKTAEALVKRFNDISNFYHELSPLDEGEKLKILKSIFVNDNRRLSKVTIDNIIRFMF